MATKKYLSLERLTEYDELIKGEISGGDASTLASAKTYADGLVNGKADKTHTHDDRYYTETEIDDKLSGINTSITNITNGSVVVKNAEHATNADNATSSADAEKLGGQLPSYYAKASDIPTGALADKDIVSESDLDSALAEKVNAAAQGNHSHANKTVLDGITSAKVSAWDNAEGNAKAYADSAASSAANAVRDELLNGAGAAYDTLKELGVLIDENKDAIDALEDIATGKANAEHSHDIDDVTGLQDALAEVLAEAIESAKTDASNKDVIVLAEAQKGIGTVQINLDTHVADTASHVDSTEKSNWDAAYSHSTSAHAPSNAQANVIESIKVNGTAQTITSKSVDITVPTTPEQVGAAPISHTHAISDITNLETTLSNAANAISTNTQSIAGHTSRIEALETKVGDGFSEITSEDIQNLFK